MELKPQDVLVVLKLALNRLSVKPTYAQLAAELGLSTSEVHAAVQRAKTARLIHSEKKSKRVDRRALLEFLIHGIKYVLPVERGFITRGLPTSYAAPPLNAEIMSGDEPPPVWPDAKGSVRGFALKPFFPTVPHAARQDPKLYELLALIDAIRDGRARERQIAERELTARLIGSESKHEQKSES